MKALDTLGAVAGITFAVLLLLGLASVDPLREATDQELISWWNTGANQRDTALSMYFILLSVPCFLVFLTVLRSRLSGQEERTQAAANLVLALGICFATVLLIGDVARGVVAHTVKFGDEPLPGPDLLRYLTTFSTVLFGLVAIPTAAVMMAVASWVALRTKAFAPWFGWFGVIASVVSLVLAALLAGPLASPLLQLWVVAGSVELWRKRGAREVIAAPHMRPSREPAS
jgi:hypothetical protein